jgi:hypothetical protein
LDQYEISTLHRKYPQASKWQSDLRNFDWIGNLLYAGDPPGSRQVYDSFASRVVNESCRGNDVTLKMIHRKIRLQQSRLAQAVTMDFCQWNLIHTWHGARQTAAGYRYHSDGYSKNMDSVQWTLDSGQWTIASLSTHRLSHAQA